MVELREEVTQAWVATIKAETRATWAERMAQEMVVLLATAPDEEDKVA
jgi:hypothetical protein